MSHCEKHHQRFDACSECIADLEQRLATQKKAIDALHEFAQSVAGGSSWWDDVWPDIEKELEAGGEG